MTTSIQAVRSLVSQVLAGTFDAASAAHRFAATPFEAGQQYDLFESIAETVQSDAEADECNAHLTCAQLAFSTR